MVRPGSRLTAVGSASAIGKLLGEDDEDLAFGVPFTEIPPTYRYRPPGVSEPR